MTTGRKELQEQLAKAEQKIADLEGELDLAKAEIERLTESRETEVQRWSEKLAAAQATTELAIAQEKECLRNSMEEAHARELGVHQDLKKALETLLREREEEIEGLKCTVSAPDPVVTPVAVVDTEARVDTGGGAEDGDSASGRLDKEAGSTGSSSGSTAGADEPTQGGVTGTEAAKSTRVSTRGDLTGAGAGVGTGKVAVRSADVARTSRESKAADTAGSVSAGAASGTKDRAELTTGCGADAVAKKGAEQDRSRTGGGVKLPPLPDFSAENKLGHESEAYERWLRKLTKHAELQNWSEREKLLHFELHLVGKAERVYEVLPGESKSSYAKATKALGDRLKPAGRKALSSAQLLRRKQRSGETVDAFVQEFEDLFEKSYGRESGIDPEFKKTLKRDLFVQGLILKWQEKVLPTAESFTEALYQARTAEEQERQLAEIHKRDLPRGVPSRPPTVAPEKSGEKSGEKPAGEKASQGRRMLRCFKCHGTGHFARECPLGKGAPAEARGSSSTVRDEPPPTLGEDSVEFQRLLKAYASVTSVTGGALGPLYFVTLTVAGSRVEALVDPGSSASIMSYDLFKQIGPKAGISAEDLQPSDVVLRNYSQNPITLSGKVNLEFKWQEKAVVSPVYLRSDREKGESLLLGTNIIIPLGLMLPAAGVEARLSSKEEAGAGLVRLVKAERIPRESGVLVRAKLEGVLGEPGPVVIEPGALCGGGSGLQMEEMVVEPDAEGYVLVMVANTSCQALSVEAGEEIGQASLLMEMPGSPEADVSAVSAQCGETGGSGVSWSPGTMSDEAVAARKERLAELLQVGSEVLDEEGLQKLKSLILEWDDVFAVEADERGEVQGLQHEVVTGDAPPIKQLPRRVPFALREELSKLVGDMLVTGVIEESSSPWSSPIVLVRKKDGSLRLCVDYRRLNSVTRKDVFPLPRIDDLLDQFAGKKVFSTLDAKSGYWQIPMSEESRPKTTFATMNGLYEFKVMPFGLCNAPATFQRLMQKVLAGLGDFCGVFIDDIVVFSDSVEEHLEHLRRLFARLRRAHLKLHPVKCRFVKRRVVYLGHVISPEGIGPNPEKVEAVERFPIPTSVKGVRQFLGLASYYRRFIPSFAKIAAPLHALTRQDVPFYWSLACQDAFQQLKDALVNPPVLVYPDFEKPFVLHTDASKEGLGAVLEQEKEDGRMHPVAYASRSLNRHEQNYGITDMEALGVVWAAKHFRAYLFGHPCVVYTDHSPLKALLNAPHPSGKLARWGQVLAELDLEIRYKPGRQNANADALSRAPADGGQLECDQPDVVVAAIEGSIVEELEDEEELPEVLRLQEEDAELQEMRELLQSGSLAEHAKLGKKQASELSRFALVEGVLWYVDSARGCRPRLVVPRSLQQKLLHETHSGPYAGHFAAKSLYDKLARRYWWRGMYADVHKHCKGCLTCASYRGGGRRTRPPLMPIKVGGPFERVGVDILEMPLTMDGNRYVVVFLDYLTKWVEAFAMPDQTSESIARLLVDHVICRHGVPRELLSDRGANLLSELMMGVCSLTGMKKVNTTAAHPQTDGLVENFNKTLRAMLAKHSRTLGCNWDVHLQQLLFAYRTKPHQSTGESPFYLLYGRDARLPTETALETLPSPYAVDCEDYCQELTKGLSGAWETARVSVGQAQRKQKRQYDRRSDDRPYLVGGRVMVYKPSEDKGKKRKLALPYHGPYRILEVRSNCVLVRPVDRPESEPILVSMDRVVRCHEELPDVSWLGPRDKRKRKKKARKKEPGTQNPEHKYPLRSRCK